eukprot:3939058-Rhodomonas_salina.3
MAGISWYAVAVVVRVASVFSHGYVHPDEFFQAQEVAADRMYNLGAHPPPPEGGARREARQRGKQGGESETDREERLGGDGVRLAGVGGGGKSRLSRTRNMPICMFAALTVCSHSLPCPLCPPAPPTLSAVYLLRRSGRLGAAMGVRCCVPLPLKRPAHAPRHVPLPHRAGHLPHPRCLLPAQRLPPRSPMLGAPALLPARPFCPAPRASMRLRPALGTAVSGIRVASVPPPHAPLLEHPRVHPLRRPPPLLARASPSPPPLRLLPPRGLSPGLSAALPRVSCSRRVYVDRHARSSIANVH